jgi:hypothetical protein
LQKVTDPQHAIVDYKAKHHPTSVVRRHRHPLAGDSTLSFKDRAASTAFIILASLKFSKLTKVSSGEHYNCYSTMNAAEYFLLAIVAIASFWIGVNSGDTGVSVGRSGVSTDIATGIQFPASSGFSVGKSMHLMAIGTRKKAILNVYSLGFYVSSQLKKEIAKSKLTACTTIQKSSQSKVVKLTFAMGVGPEKIAEAISQLSK